jgi:hypothetical protein
MYDVCVCVCVCIYIYIYNVYACMYVCMYVCMVFPFFVYVVFILV